MNKKTLTTSSKPEDVYVLPFVDFYINGNTYFKLQPIAEENVKRPDYYVDGADILIEVKEIHDRAANEKWAQWGKIIGKLQPAVDRSSLISKVKGAYLVNTPEIFKTPSHVKAHEDAAVLILQAILDGKKEVIVFGVTFKIRKAGDQGQLVAFGTYGGASSIDPPGVMHDNISKKIAAANMQLGNPPKMYKNVKNRILLLINRYIFPLHDWGPYTALSYSYSDLLTYTSIDEIWYQLQAENEFKHRLLYRRAFFEQFEGGQFVSLVDSDLALFAEWFSPIANMGDTYKEKLLVALKHFLKKEHPDKLFPERRTREDMVRLGLWLCEKKQFKDAAWLVDKFIEDNDPPNPDSYSEDKFNYHKQIIDGKDPNIITGVLGQLAWVVQGLTLDKQYIAQSLSFTEKLMKHPNHYVKLQAVIPLIEISSRRQWLKELDEENGTHLFDDFHNLAFKVVNNYGKYPAFAKWLTRIFHYYRDLSDDEALRVIEHLEGSDEVAAILIYFALFRQSHFEKLPSFNPDALQTKLRDILTSPDIRYDTLRASITWNFWRLLADEPEQFEQVKPYIDLVLQRPYKRDNYSTEHIIGEWVDKKPDICLVWYDQYIDLVIAAIKADPSLAHSIWLDIPEKVLPISAQIEPATIIERVEKLVELWKLGAFIGSPKAIFEAYKLVNNTDRSSEIKTQFILWYDEMKKLNSKLEFVDWS